MPRRDRKRHDLFLLRRAAEVRRLFVHRYPANAKLSARDLVAHVAEHVPPDVMRRDARALGEKLELTFEEKIALDIRTVECFDRPRSEVQQHYRNKKLTRDREGAKRRRAARCKVVRIPVPLSPRARAALTVIGEVAGIVTPLTGGKVATLVRSREAYQRADGAGPLDGSALRQAVRRALDELEKAGAIVTDMQPGEHGLPERLVRPATDE